MCALLFASCTDDLDPIDRPTKEDIEAQQKLSSSSSGDAASSDIQSDSNEESSSSSEPSSSSSVIVDCDTFESENKVCIDGRIYSTQHNGELWFMTEDLDGIYNFTDAKNNACPGDWRLPTIAEYEGEFGHTRISGTDYTQNLGNNFYWIGELKDGKARCFYADGLDTCDASESYSVRCVKSI